MKFVMPQTKPFSIRLANEVKDDVDRLAAMTNRYTARCRAYLRELDNAVDSIDTQPTYDAGNVIAWMEAWGTKEEKPLSEANIPAEQ